MFHSECGVFCIKPKVYVCELLPNILSQANAELEQQQPSSLLRALPSQYVDKIRPTLLVPLLGNLYFTVAKWTVQEKSDRTQETIVA